MKFFTLPQSEGFYLSVEDIEERTRFANWEALGKSGENASGRMELGYLKNKDAVYLHLGFEPESIFVDQIRDPTPGVYQPIVSQIPAGPGYFSFRMDSPLKGKVQLMVSPSGHPNDSRIIGSIPEGKGGTDCQISYSMSESWQAVFLKKMSKFEEEFSLSGFTVNVKDSVFATANHLIKPEHRALKKQGRDTIVFPPQAPAYSYFSLKFQIV